VKPIVETDVGNEGVEGSRKMFDEKKINPDDKDDLDDLIKGIAFVPDLTGTYVYAYVHMCVYI
jgi:hypothetical protein